MPVAVIETDKELDAKALRASLANKALKHDKTRMPREFVDGDTLRCRRCSQVLVFVTVVSSPPAVLGAMSLNLTKITTGTDSDTVEVRGPGVPPPSQASGR